MKRRGCSTVRVSCCRMIGHDNLDTAVWGVVSPLSFFAVVVANVVGVLLVKLHACKHSSAHDTAHKLPPTEAHLTKALTFSLDICRLNSPRQNAKASSKVSPIPCQTARCSPFTRQSKECLLPYLQEETVLHTPPVTKVMCL